MKVSAFIKNLKTKPKPVYTIGGEEVFFVNQCIDFIENEFLPEAHRHFDLTVFYGKDASFEQVYNACRKPPMFAEKNVVLLKDAQQFEDLTKFNKYIQKQLSQTIFFIIFREESIDAKTSTGKLLREYTEFIEFKPLKHLDIFNWVVEYVEELNLKIQDKSIQLLIENIGSNLTVLYNELQKIIINKKKNETIIPEDVMQYAGIHKKYNLWEFQKSLSEKNKKNIVDTMVYFIHQPKYMPLLKLLNPLYKYFTKILLAAENKKLSDRDLAIMIGVSPYFVKEYIVGANNYSTQELKKNILVLQQLDIKAKGFDVANVDEESLKKELLAKLFL